MPDTTTVTIAVFFRLLSTMRYFLLPKTQHLCELNGAYYWVAKRRAMGHIPFTILFISADLLGSGSSIALSVSTCFMRHIDLLTYIEMQTKLTFMNNTEDLRDIHNRSFIFLFMTFINHLNQTGSYLYHYLWNAFRVWKLHVLCLKHLTLSHQHVFLFEKNVPQLLKIIPWLEAQFWSFPTST